MFTQKQFTLNVGSEYNLYSAITVKLGEKEVTEYSITGEADDENAVSLTDGVLKGLQTCESGVNVLITLSAIVDGVAYETQALITVFIY